MPNPYRPPAPTVLTAQTPDKANAAMFGRVPVQINDRSDDLPALIVVDKILGASPESRIPDRVREKEGLSYGIQTWIAPFELRGQLAAQPLCDLRAAESGTAPHGDQRGDRARAEGRIHRGRGRDAKRALLQARRIARAQDASLAGGLVQQAYLGRTWDYAAEDRRRASQPSPSTA